MPVVKKVRYPEFAQRMQLACDSNPDIPLPNYGRLNWFVNQFESKYNRSLTVETLRKWFAGMTQPKSPEIMGELASLLKVDTAWLAYGVQEPDAPSKKTRQAQAIGVVNVIAGFVSMAGSVPGFPNEDDKRAQDAKIDFYAVIKGATYAFNITLGVTKGSDTIFPVKAQAVGECLLLGVVQTSPFSVEVYELDAETGRRKDGNVEVPLTPETRRITSFAERL